MWPAVIALMIPVIALMIPIVAILVSHQQKMAQIVHRGLGDNPEVSALRNEIAELKSLVHQQTITLDNMAGVHKSLDAPPPAPNLADPRSPNG